MPFSELHSLERLGDDLLPGWVLAERAVVDELPLVVKGRRPHCVPPEV